LSKLLLVSLSNLPDEDGYIQAFVDEPETQSHWRALPLLIGAMDDCVQPDNDQLPGYDSP
jgi:hypothetical protein